MRRNRLGFGLAVTAVFASLATFAAVADAQGLASVRASVTDAQGRPVADAVVVALPKDGSVIAGARPHAESLDQIDKEFVPKVKPVFVGSTVSFPNKDNVRHHVYSFSPAKRFELPLYAGVPAQPVLFDRPGVVVLGCNIHDWMIGYIYVSESPFFGKSGADGKAVLADLPARPFVLRVWHPQMEGSEEATHRDVTLVAGRTTDVAWTLALKPEVRVRRAPGVDHAGHY